MPTGVRLTGDAAVKSKLLRMAVTHPVEFQAALYIRGEHVMTVSKREFVPVDLGNLRDTGHVTKPEKTGRLFRVALVFGGPAAPYALAVHEHPSEFDPRSWKGVTVHFHPTGRGEKYLERPLLAATGTLLHDLAADLGVKLR